VVLALIAEGPTHGFAIARVLGRDGEVGRVYDVPRPLVYRAVDRLIGGGLARPLRVEAGDQGPPRTVVTATPAGRRLVRKWMVRPAEHVRDVRTELLVKLALLQRSAQDTIPLLQAQQRALEPIVAALAGQRELAEGLDHTVALWRYETALAALRFVEGTLAELMV
jgi:PadR family transcriptional regulator AphA